MLSTNILAVMSKVCILEEMNSKTTLPTIFVIFGATGDLAQRKLIPALWQLYKDKQLPTLFQVVGIAKDEMSNDEYQEWVGKYVDASDDNSEQVKIFVSIFSYHIGVFEEPVMYEKVAEKLGRQDRKWKTCANKLFYLAVPPQFYKTIFQQLADSELIKSCGADEGWTRVCVEKPFGSDLTTAQELDGLLAKLFREEQIYRVDHYLGKDTVRNILAFRFSNTFLSPAWDSRSIEKIEVVLPETSIVEGRGNFYDGIGALRDVGQNHMLQSLALLMMEKPKDWQASSIRLARAETLEALEVLDEQDVARQTVRGYYDGYKETEGVNIKSQTETYFKIQTQLRTARWQGVPIILESGKGLDESKFELTVTFRHKTPCLCPPEEGKHYKNILRYRVQPHEGIFMSFWVKRPGSKMVIEEKDFSFDYEHGFVDGEAIGAYTKLLMDAISGDQTLFVSTREIAASWRFVDPIVRVWQKEVTPLIKYEIGSGGPRGVEKKKESLPEKKIGYIGLGKMGSNMVSRLTDYGWSVLATDPDKVVREKVSKGGIGVVASAKEVVEKLESPKLVWIMVPHQVVDEVIEEIKPLLGKGDVLIDGGNSHYEESVRRAKELCKKGIVYLDVGVSGGPSGARAGACLMVGGEEAAYKQYVGLFNDLATAGGFDYMGRAGAGHFVKMIHNGIEYGMMQALGEGFEVMEKSDFDLDLERVARLYDHGSVIESSLVRWLKEAYEKYGIGLSDISGKVAHSGEGQWTVEAAKELGIPVPIIEGSLNFRKESQEQPSYTGQVVSALRNMFGGHEVKKFK